MICSNCGNAIDDQAAICVHCGAVTARGMYMGIGGRPVKPPVDPNEPANGGFIVLTRCDRKQQRQEACRKSLHNKCCGKHSILGSPIFAHYIRFVPSQPSSVLYRAFYIDPRMNISESALK